MIESFTIFQKVVEHGSFSKAAQVLGISTSTISRKIDSLEHQLKTKLFNRTTRHLTLTEQGQSALSHIEKLIDIYADLTTSLSETQQTPEGRLRISVLESFGRIKIVPLITEFLKQYPKIELELLLDNKLVDLYQDDIDLAIRIGPSNDSQLMMKKLYSNDMIVCASPDYLQDKGTPQTPDDLVSHNCLAISYNRKRCNWHFRKGNEYKAIPIMGNLLTNGGSPLIDAARQGLGIILLSRWALLDEIKAGSLVPILSDWKGSHYKDDAGDIYTIFKEGKYMRPALRAFIDFLTAKLSE